MKFGDKLIQLRKKRGLSQEELAAKLNVSRQSVSKWESNNTYPETDKIIQICNIFDCTMDDLINENIKDINTLERKNKKELNINIDPLVEFVTKTVNMFYNMKFLSGLKCLLELSIAAIILIIIGLIISEVITSTAYHIFAFLPAKALSIVSSIINGLINLAWIIITIIIVIHIFKIRYLDYYDQIMSTPKNKDDKHQNLEEENKEQTPIEKKSNPSENKTRIIIRDKEAFAFLNILAKITISFIKILAIIIGLFFAFILLLSIIGLVISISLSIYSKIFIGLDIGIIGILIIILLILGIIISFVLGTKPNVKIAIVLFFISLIITGIGTGVSLTALKDLTIQEDLSDILKITTNEQTIKYKENLVIIDKYPKSYEYIINNSLEKDTIVIQNSYDSRFNKINHHETYIHNVPVYIYYLTTKTNFKDTYNIIINDLKNNIIRKYDTYLYEDDIKIIANEATINKLIENFSRLYVYNQETTKNGYKLTNISDRINSPYSECSGEYNALTGEITAPSYCKCLKEEDPNTKIIEYTCHYIEE